eukprot:4534297-Pleurochrysis_carterae.AAC.3
MRSNGVLWKRSVDTDPNPFRRLRSPKAVCQRFLCRAERKPFEAFAINYEPRKAMRSARVALKSNEVARNRNSGKQRLFMDESQADNMQFCAHPPPHADSTHSTEHQLR